ncbi:efflux RND transporter periplasmic adaptor subunit [Colwellia sp. RSH04]|uniref:efflux RND transporter periplasmic adaptor subunit n=1 Tax=Colwellia sp. RSH04 TaxID=2305464 RepID=UPI000E592E32|nr:efflux RND transporter periplasmic adaptor subunit [Colwellia sp. RSH04]RHW76014.1 efflux RND transporter periplasmic adaptor subunit [Colwellia sp. RSH04]
MFKPFTKQFNVIKTLCLTIFSISLLGCGEPETQVATPAPAVSVYKVNTEEIGSYREFVARTEASREANLRARVEGELLERHFKEGALVEKGQVLLKIDPAEYQAALASAKADLNSKESGEDNAKRNLKRAKELIEDGYISQSDFDRLTTEESQARAAVKSATAAVEKAQLNLDYTTIIAPFTGRIGKVNYNVGNVVGPNSDALATLTLTDPMYVSFQVEESLYVSYLQSHQKTKKADDVQLNISIRLPNNSEYPHTGVLDFADTTIEQGMGTVELRAVFDNPNGIILPGLFVTLIAESKQKEKMALIPQVAVQEGQQGKFVLVVDEQNTVKQRHVVLGRRINAMWVVEEGLEAGEMVIIEGLQKVKPGIEVNGVEKSVDGVTGTISAQNSSIIKTIAAS